MDHQRYRSSSGRHGLAGKANPWLPLIGLAAVVLLLGYLASRPRGSDADQIVAALNESIKASKEGRPGGVLDKLADGFQVNNQSLASGQIADFIKKHHPDIEVLQPLPVVTADDAHIVSPVKVSFDLLGSSHGVTVDNVDIEFHRETARAWLIFPVPAWHVTKISVPEDSIGTLAPLSGFGTL